LKAELQPLAFAHLLDSRLPAEYLIPRRPFLLLLTNQFKGK
jgi:hypothetical protein